MSKVHIDIGGEGRYPKAVNLNPARIGSRGRIPRLVRGVGEHLPFRSQVAEVITLENAPQEIKRVIKPFGKIVIVNPDYYAAITHAQVIHAVGGRYKQTTRNGQTVTRIWVDP